MKHLLAALLLIVGLSAQSYSTVSFPPIPPYLLGGPSAAPWHGVASWCWGNSASYPLQCSQRTVLRSESPTGGVPAWGQWMGIGTSDGTVYPTYFAFFVVWLDDPWSTPWAPQTLPAGTGGLLSGFTTSLFQYVPYSLQTTIPATHVAQTAFDHEVSAGFQLPAYPGYSISYFTQSILLYPNGDTRLGDANRTYIQ